MQEQQQQKQPNNNTILYEYNAFILMSGIICLLCYHIYRMRKNQHTKGEKDGNHERDVVSQPHDRDLQKEIYDTIRELQIKSSMNSVEIHKLYLENYELRGKLDQIYSNDLTENINYYKNIVLLNEKIEYIQKRMLHIQHHL
jgi:hypothetical protein